MLSGSQTSGGPITKRSQRIPSRDECSPCIFHSSPNFPASWATCLCTTTWGDCSQRFKAHRGGGRGRFNTPFDSGGAKTSLEEENRKKSCCMWVAALPGVFDDEGTFPSPCFFPCLLLRISSFRSWDDQKNLIQPSLLGVCLLHLHRGSELSTRHALRWPVQWQKQPLLAAADLGETNPGSEGRLKQRFSQHKMMSSFFVDS